MTTSKRLLYFFPVFLLLTITAKADTASVYVNGSYAFANNGYGIPPYGGTLNGQSAAFYCIDFNHDISGNTSWSATVTSLTSSASYSSTRLDNENVYFEMAWLLSQMIGTSNQTLQADYQWAIWSLSVGTNASNPLDPDHMNASLIAAAQAAVGGNWTPSGSWEILTPIFGSSPQHPGTDYGQEFLVATPEPNSILLLLAGLAALFVIAVLKN